MYVVIQLIKEVFMKNKKNVFTIVLLLILLQIGIIAQTINVSVENKMSIERFETVSFNLTNSIHFECENLKVFNSNGEQIVSQLFDSNMDGNIDQIIFQDKFKPNEVKTYSIKESLEIVEIESKVFASFIEGREDIAWESNKVAFRMYGEPLKLEVDNGIDVWSKRVENLVVTKWYKEEREGQSYHVDNGEGADFFSVGKSLGCGGSALFNGDTLVQSGVYSRYEILDNGPIRTRFLLTFEFNVEGKKIVESKIIFIDANSYLNKILTHYSEIPDGYKFVAGLVIRDGLSINTDSENSIISLWGKISKNESDGELGTAVIFNSSDNVKIIEKRNHLMLGTQAKNGEALTYYTGAGWSKQSDSFNKDSWINYLMLYKERLRNPLTTTLVN